MGTIAAVGAGVEPFAVGDRVAVFHHIPCGTCYYCRKKTFAQCPVYKRVGCTAGFEPSGGGFAGYVRVMDWIVKRGLMKIPDGIPFAQAVFVEPLNTCLKGVRSLNLSADETVLVIGQGPIGIMLASLAKPIGREGAHGGSLPGAARGGGRLRARFAHRCFAGRRGGGGPRRHRGPGSRCCDSGCRRAMR